MADSTELKEKSPPHDSQSIKRIENEINKLRTHLYTIEEKIRQKTSELSSAMAQSVSLRDIDDILNLTHDISDVSTTLSVDSADSKDNNKSSTKKKKKKAAATTTMWNKLENEIKEGNIEYVKKLIQLNKLQINDYNPRSGRTVLMLASDNGQYDICSMLINLGADVKMTTKYDNTRDAQYFAHKKGHYHIEQLLLISSFGGKSSEKIKDIIKTLKKQQATCEEFIQSVSEQKHKDEENTKNEWIEHMIAYLCGLIQKKTAFSDDLLSLCWSYLVQKHKEEVINTDLWRAILKSCTQVIQGRDSNHWFWFKQFMLKSTVWLQHDPTNWQSLNYAKEAFDGLLIKHLFYLSDSQSKVNNQRLKSMQKKFASDWDSLMKFDIETHYGSNPRQDAIANGLIAKYSKEELSQNINPSQTFNALKHYDINQYLPHLLLVCHIINDEFQQCIVDAFDINPATNTNIGKDMDSIDLEKKQSFIKYRRGPIKQMARCKAKAENDYRTAQYPSAAHLLDVIRCTLIFDDVQILLAELNTFAEKVKQGKCGVIQGIARCKNGFKFWDASNPNYADIKLNVIVQTGAQYAVIGEIQFLLKDMSIFKLSAHKLYNVTRLDEEYLSLLKIKPIMIDHDKCLMNASYFNDAKEINNMMVVHQKDIKFIAEKINVKIICQTNGIKLLKVLKQYMDRDELISKLQQFGGFQIVCANGFMDMIQYIYYDILPSNTNEYDDVLKNGMAEVISAGYFEILSWMFAEQSKFMECRWLKLWKDNISVADKNSYFRMVCELGATHCAKLLVKHFGATFDPNDQSSEGYSALMKAVRKHRVETVEWLCSLKNIDLYSENTRKGRIALFEAVDVGCFKIGDLLLSHYQKEGRDPRKMLTYKADFGHTIQVFVKTAGRRGSKRKEAIEAVKKWAVEYDVVELQILEFDFDNVKFSSM